MRLTAWVKSENVADWAAVWMRVDGPGGTQLAFDNMQKRPIKGTTDWTKVEIVLDCAAEAQNLAFGVLLSGAGKVWLDDVTFAVVTADVPTTGESAPPPAQEPANLDFEK